jgi:hypothetical protein
MPSEDLLRRLAERVPKGLHANIVVIGSIATAWAFRDVARTAMVATKDIDLLPQPSVDAVSTAEALGGRLLSEGWTPRFPNDAQPGTSSTPDQDLPALRLAPPDDRDGWFVELLAEPPASQVERKRWRRFSTAHGDFGLPSFRFMRVAIHAAPEAMLGLRAPEPACMALAHLLEHADPDRTPISGLPGNPPRFVKDVGRAVALWWLANQQSPLAPTHWPAQWRNALDVAFPNRHDKLLAGASKALHVLEPYLRDAHQIALTSVLAPHATPLEAFRRAQVGGVVRSRPIAARLTVCDRCTLERVHGHASAHQGESTWGSLQSWCTRSVRIATGPFWSPQQMVRTPLRTRHLLRSRMSAPWIRTSRFTAKAKLPRARLMKSLVTR